MKSICMEQSVIVYYGSRAGLIRDGCAIVDPMFEGEELNAFLNKQTGVQKIQWKDGIFERLMNGSGENHHEVQLLKDCRIWQLKPEVDIHMKFIGYEELSRQFGEPDPDNYQPVFEGKVETNDLEALYEIFNVSHPPGYKGHSLSMSDVVELYDELGSTFHYVDRFGFKQIDFTSLGQSMTHFMQL